MFPVVPVILFTVGTGFLALGCSPLYRASALVSASLCTGPWPTHLVQGPASSLQTRSNFFIMKHDLLESGRLAFDGNAFLLLIILLN